MKNDRAFFIDIEQFKKSQIIFEMIVRLLKVLGKIIIETIYQLEFMKERWGRYAKVFLFDKPLSIQEYEIRF